MIGSLIALKKAGEGRLIFEVIAGNIPLGIATQIAKVEGPEQQRQFLQAYQKENLNQAAIRTIRRVVVQRDAFGKKMTGMPNPRKWTSAEGLVSTLKKESQRQKLVVKKTTVCEARLLFIVEAMRRLCADENFVTLLRAEKIESMPNELSQMIRAS